MKINEMETDALKDEAASLYQSIYVVECAGAMDYLRLEALCAELAKRGWEEQEVMSLQFVQKGEEGDDE